MTFRFINPSETAHVRDAINSDPEFKLASRFFSKDILLDRGRLEMHCQSSRRYRHRDQTESDLYESLEFLHQRFRGNLAEVLAAYATTHLH